MKQIFVVIFLIVAVSVAAFWSVSIGAKRAAPEPTLSSTPVEILPPDPRPNIVVINLDDADCNLLSPEMLKLYPGFNELAKRSVHFTNMHVTTPFCGPSRAALFRGQYAHRTGVRINNPKAATSLQLKGGYREFLRQGHDHDELGVWLNNAGYRTMLLGKYHHSGFDFKKPDGFDDFYVSNGGRYTETYEFTTREYAKGKGQYAGKDIYRTDREADDAVNLIQQHAKRRALQTSSGEIAQPFFFYYAPFAPHRPEGGDFTSMVNKEKYGDWQPDLTIPATPDFNEPDMSDKPIHRQLKPYSETELANLQEEYRCRARAVKSVDDFVQKTIAELKANDLYENTYFLFTTDNGYQLGHHRLMSKLDPYRMSTTAPLFVSGPDVKQRATANHLLAHIDMCPTILDLAQCPKPDFLDGKSFVDLIRNPADHDEASWRKPVILENWQVKTNRRIAMPSMYSGLRYHDKLYVEWCTGDQEYYDLANDPYELENNYDALSDSAKQKLHDDLLSSRGVEMDPIVTVLQQTVLSVHKNFPYCVRGVAEDDHSIKKIKLMVRHIERGYWNGKTWQPRRTHVEVTDFAKDQQMVSWRYDIRNAVSGLTEKDSQIINNRKVFNFALQAYAWDDKLNSSEEFRIQLRVPFTTDPWVVNTANAKSDAKSDAKLR